MQFKRYLLLSCVLLIIGCKSRKEQAYVSNIVKDTIIERTKVIYHPPILSSLTIEEICDTTTNKPKEFKQIVSVGKDTVYVEVKNNKLEISTKFLDSIKKETIDKYKSSHKAEKEVIIEYKSPKWTKYSLLFNIIGVLYILYRLRIIRI